MRITVIVKADTEKELHKRLGKAYTDIKRNKAESGEKTWKDGYYDYAYDRRYK